MKKEDGAAAKSKRFAIRIVNLCRYLCDRKEFIMSNQLLRCGTSIGANLAESACAISKRDFQSKVYISLKECVETKFWLELLHETNCISGEQFASMATDCEEIRKMLSATTITVSQQIAKGKE